MVVHPFHGAGILTANQTCQVGGVERRYHCVELVNGQGRLMIPIERAGEGGLFPATSDLLTLSGMLFAGPQELPDDFEERHRLVAAKLHSGDPKLVAQALRDLAWREHQVVKLSWIDKRHKSEAHTLLAGMLGLQFDLDALAASQLLRETVERAIQVHKVSRRAQIGQWAKEGEALAWQLLRKVKRS